MSTPVSLKVTVCGEAVQIRSDQTAQVVERVANYLNGKVDEIGRGALGPDKFRVLALAALTVAGEVFELQSKMEGYDQNKQEMLSQAKKLTEKLDRAIQAEG